MAKKPDPANESPNEQEQPVDRGAENLPVEGRNWQVAQLAAILLKEKDIQASSSPTWTWAEEYFQDRAENAIRQSRTLLQLAENQPLQKTSLYQWFNPGETYSVAELLERISELKGWKLASSENTIRTLIAAIQEEWAGRIERRNAHPQTILGSALKSRDQVMELLRPFLEDPKSREDHPKFEAAMQRFLSELIDDQILYTDEEMSTIRVERDKALLDWCFCEALTSVHLRVRAHELFRFSEEKGLLPEKWHPVELRELAETFRPLYPSRIISVRKSFARFNEQFGYSGLQCYPWHP